jgi:uncharacterized membrane protein
MKLLKLDSILLFALTIPFIMMVRLSPGDTPLWLFGLIFLALFINISLDINFFSWKSVLINRLKMICLWFVILTVIISAFFSTIVVRHQTSVIYGVHDIILQQEAAIQFLLHGTNPYSATYFNTPMAQWHYSDIEVNPALYHFVMQPFYLIFAIPFYLVMGHTPFIGYFDARLPLLFLFFSVLVMIQFLVKDEDKKRQFMVLFAFNPAMLGYMLEGRDDIFMFAFLFAALFLLFKNKNMLAGILMALAFATKQSVWPIFPFYFTYLYWNSKSLKKTVQQLIPFAVTFCIIVLPFFFWNPKAFMDSTIFYLSGNVAHSYPISGYGLGAMLHQFGFIKDVHANYPFWIWQLIIALPLLIGLLFWQRKDNSIQRLIICYGLFLFVFWYLSRYFNNSHLGYLSLVFITAYFWPERKE